MTQGLIVNIEDYLQLDLVVVAPVFTQFTLILLFQSLDINLVLLFNLGQGLFIVLAHALPFTLVLEALQILMVPLQLLFQQLDLPFISCYQVFLLLCVMIHQLLYMEIEILLYGFNSSQEVFR